MADYENDQDTGTAKMQCAECRRELLLGDDLLRVEECVIGPRGVIALDDPDEVLIFCKEECLSAFYSDAEAEVKPRRIP